MNINYIIELINNAHYIERWSELPRNIKFTLLEKEALKTMIAFILNGYEEKRNIDLYKLIQISIASLVRKAIITDLKNIIYEEIREKTDIDNYIYKKAKNFITDKELLNYILNYEKLNTKEKKLLDAASVIASDYELSFIKGINKKNKEYKTILKSFKKTQKKVLKIKGYRKYKKDKKIKDIFDIFNSLRFQKRGNRLPLINKFSVLGHLYSTFVISYFLTKLYIKINNINDNNLIKEKIIFNCFTSLFHDLPEALTRDIITPVKKEIPELDNILENIEYKLVNKKIIKKLPKSIKKVFRIIMFKPFDNKLINLTTLKDIKNIRKYIKVNNSEELIDKYGIDGELLKLSDNIFAYMELVQNPVKNKEINYAIKRIENFYKNKNILGLKAFEFFNNIKNNYI